MKKLITSFILMTMLALTIAPSMVLASSVESDIEDRLDPIADLYGGSSGVDEGNLAESIASIIQILLSLLGVIFIILIIYAGFMWMTSAGNEERISKAKKVFIAAIIGVAIVLAAYLITVFVIQGLIDATT